MRIGNTMRPVIKWSGSKRTQAQTIIEYFPRFEVYYEPFLGGGSILGAIRPRKAVCWDICKPLIDLWKEIKKQPEILFNEYKKRWGRMDSEGYQVYYEVRNSFNKKQSPVDLLFLTRTCVNGLIRFNQNGHFNNSLHYTRKGIQPESLKEILNEWNDIVQSLSFFCGDYSKIVQDLTKNDFVYLDPPYFNTKGRYYGTINYEDFLSFLELLNRKLIKFALSFDGKTSEKDYIVQIPKELYKRHYLIKSGHSSFRKVIDKKNSIVEESLYLNY